MKYYVISKVTGAVDVRDNAKSVAAHLLGRDLRNLFIIKSDDNGDRLYTPSTGDVFVIEKELEAL